MLKRRVKLVWVVAVTATALGISYGMMSENEELEMPTVGECRGVGYG